MQASAANYPWADELEKTVVNSLVTSFGLDFLLFKDKLGGEVNTVHNVRQKVWATDEAQRRYEQRGDYAEQSAAYHQHENYQATGARDKGLQQEGNLHDAYRSKTMAAHEQRNGYTRPDDVIEVVALRATARLASPVGLGDLPPIERAAAVGPAIIAEPDCTIWVPAGWRAEPHASGALIITRIEP